MVCTEGVTFEDREKIRGTAKEKLQEVGIPLCATYKYLGTFVGEDMTSLNSIQLVVRNIMIRFEAWRPLLLSRSLRFKVNSFILYALPLLLMVPLMLPNGKGSKMAMERFGKAFRQCAKTWLGLPKSFSTEGLYWLIGTDPEKVTAFVKEMG